VPAASSAILLVGHAVFIPQAGNDGHLASKNQCFEPLAASIIAWYTELSHSWAKPELVGQNAAFSYMVLTMMLHDAGGFRIATQHLIHFHNSITPSYVHYEGSHMHACNLPFLMSNTPVHTAISSADLFKGLLNSKQALTKAEFSWSLVPGPNLSLTELLVRYTFTILGQSRVKSCEVLTQVTNHTIQNPTSKEAFPDFYASSESGVALSKILGCA